MKARILILSALTAAALALTAVAQAKGPASATISGPELDGPLAITGYGEGGSSTPLGALVEGGGFFPAAFGQSPDPMLDKRPNGELGPRYTISYRVPGPNNEDDTIVTDVYPYAEPVAVTYTAPGQPFFGTEKTRGGWFVGRPDLKQVLVDAGLPATAPGSGGSGLGLPDVPGPLAVGGAVALVILAGGAWLVVARRRPEPAR
jgi:hypothetical protein